MKAEDTFSTKDGNKQKSPFHAFGYALLVYTKAMLAMEKREIEEAVECLFDVEVMLKRIMSTTRKKRKSHQVSPPPPPTVVCNSIHSSISVPLDMFDDSSTKQRDQSLPCHDGLELQFELLHANCTLMSATLQFLRDSWIDNIKAAYDLRKAFKIYERLFETITSVTIAEYETAVIQRQPVINGKIRTRRTVSCDDGIRQQKHYFDNNISLYEGTVEHGAFFGIGLFNVIFSLLPTKGNYPTSVVHIFAY
jgi:hypothetical protein